jgi:hypothetical protein
MFAIPRRKNCHVLSLNHDGLNGSKSVNPASIITLIMAEEPAKHFLYILTYA